MSSGTPDAAHAGMHAWSFLIGMIIAYVVIYRTLICGQYLVIISMCVVLGVGVSV